jgi:hypothetical protein
VCAQCGKTNNHEGSGLMKSTNEEGRKTKMGEEDEEMEG